MTVPNVNLTGLFALPIFGAVAACGPASPEGSLSLTVTMKDGEVITHSRPWDSGGVTGDCLLTHGGPHVNSGGWDLSHISVSSRVLKPADGEPYRFVSLRVGEMPGGRVVNNWVVVSNGERPVRDVDGSDPARTFEAWLSTGVEELSHFEPDGQLLKVRLAGSGRPAAGDVTKIARVDYVLEGHAPHLRTAPKSRQPIDYCRDQWGQAS